MPSASQHEKKAERNRRFTDSISHEQFPEWAVVAAFYTALHLVEQLRAVTENSDSTSHEDRLVWVQHHFPSNIHSAFRILLAMSMLARYHSMAEFFRQFQPEDIQKKIIEDRLEVIEHYVQTEVIRRTSVN